MAQELRLQAESFKLRLDQALAAAQKVEAYTETQPEIGHRVWAHPKTREEDAKSLQARLNDANSSLTKSLTQEHQDKVIALLGQNDQEIRMLTAELTNTQSKIEIPSKARNKAVKEITNKTEKTTNFKKTPGVVTGLKSGSRLSGSQKEPIAPTARKGSRGVPDSYASQSEINHGAKGNEQGNQALTKDPDALLVEATLVEPKENERLIRELRRKLAKQTRVLDYKLKEMKTKMTQVEMTTSLKEALEEKYQIKSLRWSIELVKLKNEHRIL